MKNSSIWLGAFFLFGVFTSEAQEKKKMSLDEAIQLAMTQSTEAKLADTKVATKEFEMQTVKNRQYPDLKISGQYQRLTNADVKLKLGGSGEESGAAPKVNQLMLGQASASLPLFAGFKIQNNIKAAENLYQAEQYTAKNTKEQLALDVVKLYVNLFKAQESTSLIAENIKSAEQRVKDFTAMEQNGLFARNDLLKAR